MDMNTNAPVEQVRMSSPGVFSTGLPSIATLATGVLLFLLPFIDIKCNNVSLKTVSGFELATGFSVGKGGNNTLFNDNEQTSTKEKKDGNIYAIIALALGVVALGLSFVNAKAGITGAMITAIGAAVALIGLMIDIKKQVNLDKGGTTGDHLTENINIRVEFTPWFYISLIAFVVAAFFCFKRLQSSSVK